MAEPVDIAEQEGDRQSPGDRAERQEVPLRGAASRSRGSRRPRSENDRQHQAEPGRMAVERRHPGCRIGRDADERRLAERHDAADAGQQREPDRGERIDADVVQQRDGERIEHEGAAPGKATAAAATRRIWSGVIPRLPLQYAARRSSATAGSGSAARRR